jgi:hypothetical protein
MIADFFYIGLIIKFIIQRKQKILGCITERLTASKVENY